MLGTKGCSAADVPSMVVGSSDWLGILALTILVMWLELRRAPLSETAELRIVRILLCSLLAAVILTAMAGMVYSMAIFELRQSVAQLDAAMKVLQSKLQ